MRALIKNDCVIVEPFDAWTMANLAYLTGAERDPEGRPLRGDGWVLVEDFVPPAEAEEPVIESETVTAPAPAETEKTVTIDGKEYTREELIALLGDKL